MSKNGGNKNLNMITENITIKPQSDLEQLTSTLRIQHVFSRSASLVLTSNR